MSQQINSIFQASDYEALAEQHISPADYAYISGGAGHEKTLSANRLAFDAISLTQRAFADFSEASTKTTLLEKPFRHPILLAPVAAQSLVHVDGEIATAQAANALEAGFILSTLSSKPIKEVAKQINQNKWFQLYFQPKQQTTLDLVKNAEKADFEAIVVTLDTPIQSLSIRAQINNFSLPEHALPANLPSNTPQNTIELSANESVIFQGLMSSAPSLESIAWLVKQTSLPILVKGVMASDEIAALIDIGVQGLIISNHGGRALDGTPASLTLLPQIRAQVGPDFPLLLDSGIRSGSDIFKALAMGADAVCIGRLQIYALAMHGVQGVAHLLKLLRDELELCMALTGCPSIASINQSRLYVED